MMAQYESFPAATPGLRTRDRSPRSDLSDEYTLSEDGVPMLRSPPKRNSSLNKRDTVSFSDDLINKFDTLRITMRWEYELEKDKRLSENTFDNWQGMDLTLKGPSPVPSSESRQRNPIPSFDPPTLNNKSASAASRFLHSASSSSSFSGMLNAHTPSQRSASSVERHRAPIPSFEPPPAPAPIASVSTPSVGGDSYSFVSNPSTHSTSAAVAAAAAAAAAAIPPPPLPPHLSSKPGLSPLSGAPVLPGPKKIEKLKYQVDSEPLETEHESNERPTSSGKNRKSLMGRLFGGTIRESKSSDHLSTQKTATLSRASAPPSSRDQAPEEEWGLNDASNIQSNTLRRIDTNEFKPAENKKSEKTLVEDNFSSVPFYRNIPYEPQLTELRKADKTLVEDDFGSDTPPLRRAITNPEADTRQNITTSIGARSRSKLPTIDSDSSSGSLHPPTFPGRTDNSSSQHSSSPYGTLNTTNFLDEDEPLAAIRNVLAGISPAPSPAFGNRPLPPQHLALPEHGYDERPVSSQGQAFSYARTQPTPAAAVRPVSANGRVEDTQGRSMWGAMFGTVKRKRGKDKAKQEAAAEKAAEKAGRRASAKSDEHSVSSEPTKKMFGSTKKKPKKEGRKVGWGWWGKRGKKEGNQEGNQEGGRQEGKLKGKQKGKQKGGA
ncbi:hypothetical protein BC937DRAFT_94322 [Endogone sp. FLAS-F59071]|nr:hypothetical protein BC937DRAFT_94322 [Endogone sp. FLAS-F59071]|eukprot:RUS14120.1 hypothetical protein BC937DRAFT_94322 [Endogone sp. FLAS-F59071]